MCTVVILNRVHPEYPVVVAANRDEFYARTTHDPRVVHDSPRIVCGVDGDKGGTWMGVTDAGLFVGLTNQRTYSPADSQLQSRGQAVWQAQSLRKSLSKSTIYFSAMLTTCGL